MRSVGGEARSYLPSASGKLQRRDVSAWITERPRCSHELFVHAVEVLRKYFPVMHHEASPDAQKRPSILSRRPRCVLMKYYVATSCVITSDCRSLPPGGHPRVRPHGATDFMRAHPSERALRPAQINR